VRGRAVRLLPVTKRSIDDLLADVQSSLDRVTPEAAPRLMAGGALIVDTRSADHREREGTIPGSIWVERNVLEWRLDPASAHKIPQVASYDQVVIVVCDEGYSSSLAARSLQDLGLSRATDLVGGFRAWKAAGLPVE
jgi:rhodanese-related sulfurtransferase